MRTMSFDHIHLIPLITPDPPLHLPSPTSCPFSHKLLGVLSDAYMHTNVRSSTQA